MSIYLFLSVAVEFIHLVLICFITYGFFTKNKRVRLLHSITLFSIAPVQLLFMGRCPLTLLSWYLRSMADPSRATPQYVHPFTLKLLQNWFGLDVSETSILMLTVCLFIVGFVSLVWTITEKPT